MKLYLDTANVKEIREAASLGVLDGVTTNPSLVAKEGRSFHEALVEICRVVKPGGRIAIIPGVDGRSTTNIVRRLNAEYRE